MKKQFERMWGKEEIKHSLMLLKNRASSEWKKSKANLLLFSCKLFLSHPPHPLPFKKILKARHPFPELQLRCAPTLPESPRQLEVGTRGCHPITFSLPWNL